MRKSLVTAAFAASIISATAAFAATADVGPIKTLDQAKHQLILTDGKVFTLPATWSGAGFKVGDKVKVIYQIQDGKMMASEVSKAS